MPQLIVGRKSHPARGAWIEICSGISGCVSSGTSHPARGAWIEIAVRCVRDGRVRSHPARGAWIEMQYTGAHISRLRRTPQGVRGLKSHPNSLANLKKGSHPARGAWIEIRHNAF